MRNFITAATVSLCFVGAAQAAPGFSLDFNGSGNTLAATGFTGVFNLDTTGFSVGGGKLTTNTLGGDSFGDYDNDPDSAKNWMYNSVDVGAQTIATARMTVNSLSGNFHGGGIWMGTDQDHYVRFGIFHNSFVSGGPVAVELLRENEDRWTGRNPGNPGDDIVSPAAPGIGGLNTLPRDVILRLTRTGNTVQGEYSVDNGGSFATLGPIGGFALPGNTTGLSDTIESNTLKVGVYTAGDPGASFSFDSLVVTPEPTSVASLALGALLLRRRR